MSSVPNVIHFNCQSCGMLLTVPKELAGVTGPCPHCGTTITSPTTAPPAPLPGPSWPAAENAATTATAAAETSPQPELESPPVPAPAPDPVSASALAPLPLPLPVPAYPAPTYPPAPPAPGMVERSVSTSPHTSPSSTWEASNPPQASPLPPAVGGGVLNRSWPPVGTDLPPGASPSSTPSVMESVLQMPGAQASQAGRPGYPQASPGGPVPRNPQAAAPRSKPSQGASSGRKATSVLALLVTVLALAGAAWFFRDKLNEAWKTFTANRKAEAASLEFHPAAPVPDEPATSASTAPAPETPAAPEGQPAPSPAPAARTPSGAASEGSEGTPSLAAPPSAGSASSLSPATSPTPSSTPDEQVQRPSGMASSSSSGDTQPPATAPKPGTPVSEASTTPRATPPPPPPPSPSPAPNLAETPSRTAPAPKNNDPSPGTAFTPPMRASTPTPPPAPVQETLYEKVSEEVQPALDALKQFLGAPSWEERLRVVQSAELIKPRMQSYYAAIPYNPLHVGKVNLIRHDKTSPNGPPLCIFEIEGGDLKRPVPVMVEEAVDGWKVDWVTFTEFKDNFLARFMESPKEGAKRFHVLVRRTHYFDDDVPELDKKICMEVQAPMPPYVGSVFARRGTQLANILDRYLGWQVDQAAVVVELEWRREGDKQWVELTNLPQFNWRNAVAHEWTPPSHAPPPAPVAVPVK